MTLHVACRRILFSAACLIAFVSVCSALEEDRSAGAFRWEGTRFAFCLITDDGTKCNLGWAQLGIEEDFRFSIAVNSGKVAAHLLSRDEMIQLHDEGFEISNHTCTHCMEGLPESCAKPPRGSVLGYFLCDGIDNEAAMAQFSLEISRQVLADSVCCPASEIRTLAYPRHMYSHAVIDSLIARGYHGARFGDSGSYSYFSNGEFTTPPRNTWEGGISLFRVPLMHYATVFFGNHSADPPIHYTHEQFVAATMPYIEQARRDGGIFAIYAHHFGDDCDEPMDINYNSSGMTVQDLEWMIDLVRENGGRVMTFGDAVDYYRSRSEMVDLDGDYVWVPTGTTDVPSSTALGLDLRCSPNPFNPATVVDYYVAQDAELSVMVHDPRGGLVVDLVRGPQVAGWHRVEWGGRDAAGAIVSSGVYFVTVRAGDGVATKRVTLLK